jgi:N-acetylglucosaminyldiphosphoundecaprenol N-acetyl-beta-D-mannosaminyltransferase
VTRAPEAAPRAGGVGRPGSCSEPFDTVELCGVRLHKVTQAGCVAQVMEALAAGRGGWVVTPNLDHLRRLQSDAEFRALYAQADLRVADGMPLVWASALRGERLPERVAGSDLIFSLSEAAAGAGRSVFLLGGDAGTAEGAAAELRRRNPQLRVAGTHYPPPGFEADPAAVAAMRAAVVQAAPDVVFVALGSPRQERLIAELRGELPRAWWLGVGISFSFAAGAVRRAPPWVRRSGLEWVHRLAQEPRRLARRYLVDGLPFAARLLVSSAWARWSRRRRARQRP